jgi:hypothetical protein
VTSGDTTSFIIRFQPTSTGPKTATISIANNTLDKNPYDITLQGYGVPLGGLVAYYPFNGNANDESGNGHNGTIYGSPTYSDDRNGNPSGALNFDGISNYVELPDESSFDLPQTTIVAIVKVPNYAKRNPIISKGSNFGSFTVHIVSQDGLPYYTYLVSGGNETEYLANEPVPLNQFFHLVSTYDSGSRRLQGYLNGELKSDLTCQNSPLMNNENVTIGLSPFLTPTPYEFFNGVIDEIRIYDRILSASEIQALYAGALMGSQLSGVLSTDNGSDCDAGCNFFNWDTTGVLDPGPRLAVVTSGVEFCDCRYPASILFTTDFDSDSLTITYTNGPGTNAVTALKFRFTNINFGTGIGQVLKVIDTFPSPGPYPAPQYPPEITWGDSWIQVRISGFGGFDGIPPNAVYKLKLQLVSK